ncbi:MAG: hypothetical protein AAGJ93_00820, partial [Bacteroidota bacterium]
LNFINILTYPRELNHTSKKQKTAKSFKSLFRDFKSALQDRHVVQLMNSAALHTAFLKAIKDYIQPVMYQLAILLPILTTIDIKRKSGLVIGVIYFVIFLLTSYASKSAFKLIALKKRNIPQWTLLAGLAAGSISGFLSIKEWWVAALLVFIAVFVIENLRKPILTATLSDSIPNEVLTSVFSAQSFYATIITASIAIALGVVADQLGIGYALLVISASLVMLNTLVGNPDLQKRF